MRDNLHEGSQYHWNARTTNPSPPTSICEAQYVYDNRLRQSRLVSVKVITSTITGYVTADKYLKHITSTITDYVTAD